MKYIHPQAVYQWKYVDFSVKQVWFELKRMGFAAVVHTEVLVKKQLGHWDQENTLPIFACVRAITLPSPREIGMKNWMNVCIDNSSWYFFPSAFQIALFLLPHIYCSLCCASKTQCLSLGEFTALCSLFCILILRDYYEIITFCMWVGTLKYVSCRWTDGVLAVHIGFTQTSLSPLIQGPAAFSPLGSLCCPLYHQMFFRTDICACLSLRNCWVEEYKHCCLIVSVARCSMRQQLLLRGMSGLGHSWCPWDQPSPSYGHWPPLITRPGEHKAVPGIYSHPSAFCRKTQNYMKKLVEPCFWLVEVLI